MINKKIISLILIIGKIWSFHLCSMQEVKKEEKNKPHKQETQYRPSTLDKNKLKNYIASLDATLEKKIKSSSTDTPSDWINYLLEYSGPATFYKHVIYNEKYNNKTQHICFLPREIVNIIIPCVALQEKLIYQGSPVAQTLASRIAHACDNNSRLITTLQRLPSFMIKDIYQKMTCYKTLIKGQQLAQNYYVNTLTIYNGDRMIAFGSQKQLCLWNIKTNTLSKSMSTPCSITTIAWNQEKIAAGCMNGSINIWNLGTNYQYTLPGKDQIDAVAFNSKGDTLIARTELGVTIWDLKKEDSLNLKEYNLHQCARFSADGSILVSPYLGGIAIWDLNEKKEVQFINEGRNLFAFSPNGHYFIANSRESKTFIYNITEKSTLYIPCTEEIVAAAFCCNDAMITTSSQEGTLSLWNTKTGTLITSLPHQTIMKEITCSHHGKIIVCVTTEGAIVLYRIYHDKNNEMQNTVNTIKNS